MVYKELLEKAWQAEHAYYTLDKPVLTDQEYDELMAQLKEYETAYPYQIDPDSPTQRVGGKVSGKFLKVKHPRKMLSLENAFSLEDLQAFANRVPVEDVSYLVEPKLDGLTLVCFYDHGRLQKAVTRGDGLIGEDVTATARTIKGLPLKVSYDGSFQVRGEVMMERKVFEDLNAKLISENKQPFANPRNAAAGSLRQRDPKETASRHLVVCFYDAFGYPPLEEITTEYCKMHWMESVGLPTLASVSYFAFTINAAYKACIGLENVRDKLSFDIDGAVVKVESLVVQQEMGEANKFPYWAIAYKFKAQHVASTLKSVEWQVGRTGQITPVAVLEPIQIAGSTVDHASLHNVDYIKSMHLRVGDRVSVYKAAEIIPQVSTVLSTAPENPMVEVPVNCPCCGTALTTSGAALICPNALCTAKIKASIEFFGSREHMDIQGLGPAVITQLVDTKLCMSPSDLYKLTEKQLLCLEGFAEKKAQALLFEIANSKNKPYQKVLASLGVDMLGDTMSVEFAKRWPKMDLLLSAMAMSFKEIPGVADITAATIWGSLHEDRVLSLISSLRAAGLNMCAEEAKEPQTLTSMSICITGSLSKDRDYYKEQIIAHGGRFATSVSSKTTYLVAGVGGGEKRNKANKLGVPIITEEELVELIQHGSN